MNITKRHLDCPLLNVIINFVSDIILKYLEMWDKRAHTIWFWMNMLRNVCVYIQISDFDLILIFLANMSSFSKFWEKKTKLKDRRLQQNVPSAINSVFLTEISSKHVTALKDVVKWTRVITNKPEQMRMCLVIVYEISTTDWFCKLILHYWQKLFKN